MTAINFPLSTAVAVSHNFWYVVLCFYFHSISSIFLTSLETSSLTNELFGSCLISKYFGDAPVIFCYWFLIWLQSENTLYIISILQNFSCFMAQNMIHFAICPTGTWNATCILLLSRACCKCAVGWWWHWVILYSTYLLIF